MLKTIPKFDICTLSENKEEHIMVSRFADYLLEHQNLVFPHRHSFYHLVYFTAGAGSHTIDFNNFEVQSDQIYFMVPGQVHEWNFTETMSGYLVNFSQDFFQSFLLRPAYLDSFYFLNGATEQSVINLPEEVAIKVKLLFEDLMVQSGSEHLMREDLIRVILIQIFIRIQQTKNGVEPDRSLPQPNLTLKNFQKLIEKNFMHLKQPGQYADLLAITPNHLNALCKEHLGLQAGEVIRLRITLEAKRLLVNMGLSISEIAFQLKFEDKSYFTKFFKKQTGMPPEVFRKKMITQRQ